MLQELDEMELPPQCHIKLGPLQVATSKHDEGALPSV